MFYHHPFGLIGRARGVYHICQVIERSVDVELSIEASGPTIVSSPSDPWNETVEPLGTVALMFSASLSAPPLIVKLSTSG